MIVSTDGIAIDPEKIKSVQDWKPPRTKQGVMSFLGFWNFVRDFIQDYSALSASLNDLLKKDILFDWKDEHQAAFTYLKTAITQAPVCKYFDPYLETKIEVDAPDTIVGGILS